ncbi:MAG: prepilin-type N-terminal cleavage/methylation domain-containing protein [Leptospirales bacterium]|nr:prepilin-type N-terminal cleavage/methylation domain-containing protein [Leptospirales bacterium]
MKRESSFSRSRARSLRLAARCRARLRAGVTLIEMAVVIAVLALIFVLVYSNLNLNVIDDAKVLVFTGQAKTLPIKLQRWELTHGSLADGASLEQITDDPAEVKDPWGHPYFACAGSDGRVNQICSWGADGENSSTRFFITQRSSWPSEFRPEDKPQEQ